MTGISVPVDLSAPPKRYAPVNRCIYCSVYSGQLTLEHIVPYGLAGNALLLPKASCKTCESITGQFEQICLRTILGPFRLRFNSPTRNPKDRPATLPLVLATAIDSEPIPLQTITVPVPEFPMAFVGLRLRRARILDGKEPLRLRDDESQTAVDGEIWGKSSPEDMARYVPQGIKMDYGFQLGKIQPVAFAKQIAKIAHAYAVAELGLNAFRPLATELILGKTDTLSQWVGGEWEIPPPSDALFDLRLEKISSKGKNFLLVHVRLFSFFGTPQYHVVVGET